MATLRPVAELQSSVGCVVMWALTPEVFDRLTGRCCGPLPGVRRSDFCFGHSIAVVIPGATGLPTTIRFADDAKTEIRTPEPASL
jgi:hypothetical protein